MRIFVDKKENLGLDLDGVLYPWVSAVWMYYRMYKKYSGTEYEFYKNFDKNVPEDQCNYIATLQDLYYKHTPSPKLTSLLNQLSEKFNLFYITARPLEAERVTHKYFRDFKIPQRDNLIFSPEKDTYARLLRLHYFVEDSVRNAEKLSKICTTFLVRTPYNEDYSGEVPMLNSILDLERILL